LEKADREKYNKVKTRNNLIRCHPMFQLKFKVACSGILSFLLCHYAVCFFVLGMFLVLIKLGASFLPNFYFLGIHHSRQIQTKYNIYQHV
jgi:hypothetical protein